MFVVTSYCFTHPYINGLLSMSNNNHSQLIEYLSPEDGLILHDDLILRTILEVGEVRGASVTYLTDDDVLVMIV